MPSACTRDGGWNNLPDKLYGASPQLFCAFDNTALSVRVIQERGAKKKARKWKKTNNHSL